MSTFVLNHQKTNFLLTVFFPTPQLSRMMGLDVIAQKRDWHIQPCSKDDIESARQGLCKLVTLISPHDGETAEQNRI